jgi:hypothetical protein
LSLRYEAQQILISKLIGSSLLTAFASVANDLFIHGAHPWVVNGAECREAFVIVDAVVVDLDDGHLLNFFGGEESELDFAHLV